MKKAKIIISACAAVMLAAAVFTVYILFFNMPTPKITNAKTPFKAELSEPEKCISDHYDNTTIDEERFAKNPWDMQVFDNKVYIGCGDYDKNTGSAPIYFYDNETKSFRFSECLGSEQIERFYIFGNRLFTTAIDPVYWGHGEYYSREENSESDGFDYFETLPSNIHCYDMCSFDDKYFFCGSVMDYDNYSMIQYVDSDDVLSGDTEKTKQIFLYKDGEKIKEQYRVYDMFEYKDKLYAWHLAPSLVNQLNGFDVKPEDAASGLFVYNKAENRFDCVEGEVSLTPIINNIEKDENCEDFMYIQHKLEYNGKMVFINNGMFYTNDLKEYKTCSLGEDFADYIVRDALVREGQLYVVASCETDSGNYKTSVFVTEDLSKFSEVLYFETESYIKSFEYIDKTFIFGEGGRYENTAASCGNIYTCKVK